MTKPAKLLKKYLIGFILIAILPLIGHWMRRGSDHRCALDGVAIEPVFRVRIVDAHQAALEFCSLRCAELWLEHNPAPVDAMYVTDEATGKEIEAASAIYVRSLVVTQAGNGNRVHAFARRADAERHADVSHGTILTKAK